MKTLYAAFALLIMGAFFAGTAQAAPAGPVTNRPALESQLTPVASYNCRRDYRGWHFLRGNRRFACQPHRSRDRYIRSWGRSCIGWGCGGQRHQPRYHRRNNRW